MFSPDKKNEIENNSTTHVGDFGLAAISSDAVAYQSAVLKFMLEVVEAGGTAAPGGAVAGRDVACSEMLSGKFKEKAKVIHGPDAIFRLPELETTYLWIAKNSGFIEAADAKMTHIVLSPHDLMAARNINESFGRAVLAVPSSPEALEEVGEYFQCITYDDLLHEARMHKENSECGCKLIVTPVSRWRTVNKLCTSRKAARTRRTSFKAPDVEHAFNRYCDLLEAQLAQIH